MGTATAGMDVVQVRVYLATAQALQAGIWFSSTVTRYEYNG